MMLENFLVRSALAGIAIALAAGPLGCFVVWRRMAYFGDATAHAAILGVALSFAFSLSVFAGVLVAALVMATTVSRLYGGVYAMDTLLGVTAHAALAVGLVAVSFLSGVRMDLLAYLFGDILAVNTTDLAVIWLGAIAVALILGVRWSALLTATLNSDVATAGGLDPAQGATRTDTGTGGSGRSRNQGRWRVVDYCHVDHSGRGRTPVFSHPRNHGGGGSDHRHDFGPWRARRLC